MYIYDLVDNFYLIKCEKCGQTLKLHKTYFKQYGDEYWSHRILECSCGKKVKILKYKKDINPNENTTNQETQKQADKSIENGSIPVRLSFSDVLKIKEYKIEIGILRGQVEELIKEKTGIENKLNKEKKLLKNQLETIQGDCESLNATIDEYKSVLVNEHYEAINIKKHLISLKEKENSLLKRNTEIEDKIRESQDRIEALKKETIELEDEILYQSFGLYTPLYDFTKSEEYKNKLDEIRKKQKELVKEKNAVIQLNQWNVNGSDRRGNKLANDIIKQALRCFNIECEYTISRVKFNNFNSMHDRITKSFESLNKLNGIYGIEIKSEYLDLKHQELELAYGFILKKQEEKEVIRELREQQKEEAKFLKEIEERRKEIEKEQQHYNNALRKLNDQIEAEKSEIRLSFLLEKKNEIENNLVDLDKAIEDIDYREANHRAGYVYIISNIGAFGENIYKIGMTRRLEPLDRIDELGSASVPFKFDLHAMIFSDDAPKLESALHQAFEAKKINMMNNRKEFFYVTLDEIEEVVKVNHDKTVDFVKIPPAQQYRESIRIKDKFK